MYRVEELLGGRTSMCVCVIVCVCVCGNHVCVWIVCVMGLCVCVGAGERTSGEEGQHVCVMVYYV